MASHIPFSLFLRDLFRPNFFFASGGAHLAARSPLLLPAPLLLGGRFTGIGTCCRFFFSSPFARGFKDIGHTYFFPPPFAGFPLWNILFSPPYRFFSCSLPPPSGAPHYVLKPLHPPPSSSFKESYTLFFSTEAYAPHVPSAG